jgi:hypothetical protein
MAKTKSRDLRLRLLVGVLAGLGAVFACFAAPVLHPPATTFAAVSILFWMAAVWMAARR